MSISDVLHVNLIERAHLPCLLHQRASSGTRKGSGRTGSANMPGSAGSRNNSAGSGEYQCQETSSFLSHKTVTHQKTFVNM